MSALLPVPVPEVGPCGLWERQRKCSVRFSSNPAASLSLSLSLYQLTLIYGGLRLAFLFQVSLDLVLCHREYLSIKSPDSVLIKGPQMIVCVCVLVWVGTSDFSMLIFR